MDEFLDHVDWHKLKWQKWTLLAVINDTKEQQVFDEYKEAIKDLYGLVHLLDKLQDYAEAKGYPVEWLTEDEEDGTGRR